MATKKKVDYNIVAKNIIANVGGKENVNIPASASS